MPLPLIAEHLAEPGREGGRFLSGVEMGDVPHPQGPEGGDALLALLGHDLRHGGGSQGQAVPQDKGRRVPQVGQEGADDAEVAVTGDGLGVLLDYPVVAALPGVPVGFQKSVQFPAHTVVHLGGVAALGHQGLAPAV